jgi:glycerate 2-kinase
VAGRIGAGDPALLARAWAPGLRSDPLSLDPQIVVAPDSFKGTFSALEVANALARGLERGGAIPDVCPLADGGEGTLDVLLAALGGGRRRARASDPLGRPLEARFALLGDGTTAVVEVAAASGLGLVASDERDPVAASSRGTGELLVAAAAAGARRILVAAGGSATTDGGAGAVEVVEEAGGLGDVDVTILADVTTAFERAAEVYGPQKGASPAQVDGLTRRLLALAEALPRDPRGVAMTGAAGGLAGGLWAALGARLVRGAPFVLDAVGFDARLRLATATVTGEGRLDRQTFEGKVVAEVAARCRHHGRECHAVVGSSELSADDLRELGIARLHEATTRAELEEVGYLLAPEAR